MDRVTRSAETEKAQIEQMLFEANQYLDASLIDEAKDLYLRILARDVRHSPSLFGLARIAQKAGSPDVAEKLLRRALAVDGENIDYRFALGTALQAQRKYDEAIAEFRCVLEEDESHWLALFRLGNTFQLDGKLDEAVATYERILQIDPQSHDAEFNIGNVRRLQGNLAEARQHYTKALQLGPDNADARWNLSLLDLLEGDYSAGWKNYEARQERPTPHLRSFPQPQWRGEPPNGARILLHAEQGFGDTIQFLRYVPMVSAAGGQVLLDVPPEIRRLAAAMEEVAAVTSTGEPIPEFDWQCPLMSLPLAFGTRLETIPNDVPYLIVPHEAEEAAAALQWPEDGLRVGLVWGATTRQFEDSDRSIPLSLFDPILATPEVHFFSLQLGSQANELDSLQTPIADLREAIGDFADTAALISHLDLVLTVDTSAAHVAGALGKPTWVLLPFSSDWRWLVGRDDSPWYPTVRLFRQAKPRDWQSVLERARSALGSLLNPRAK